MEISGIRITRVEKKRAVVVAISFLPELERIFDASPLGEMVCGAWLSPLFSAWLTQSDDLQAGVIGLYRHRHHGP
jgi:hypothetical protein